jgi:hypothetical protein
MVRGVLASEALMERGFPRESAFPEDGRFAFLNAPGRAGYFFTGAGRRKMMTFSVTVDGSQPSLASLLT